MFRKSILSKILGVVIAVAIIGFGGLIYRVIEQGKKNLLEERKRASELMAEPILESIYDDMLRERADIARYFIKGVQSIKGVERVQIIRSNGIEEAFQDFKTLKTVEKEYGKLKPEWTADHPDKQNNVAQGVDKPEFKEAVKLFNKGKKESVSYIEESVDKRLLTYLVPIVARPKCKSCHGVEQSARGVLMISTSLEDMYASSASNRERWLIYGLFTILSITVLLAFLVRGIIRPLQRLSSAAEDIANGNFKISVPVQTSDEIGRLSRSFNKMAHEVEVRTKELQKLSMAIEQSVNGVFIVGRNGVIEYVNTMFEQITGYSKEEMVGHDLRTFASEIMTKNEYEGLWKTISAGNTWQGSYKHKKKYGQPYWCNCLISPIKDKKENITHFLLIQEDITKKKESEERIQHLASYDELTGLINRTRFMELMDEWIAYAKTKPAIAGHPQTGALLLIDIDEFRYINDTYGHNIGDEFLRGAAKILGNTINDMAAQNIKRAKEKSIIGRLGGDEFAIFMSYTDVKETIDVVELIRKKIGSIHSFISASVQLTASIGIAFYPKHGAATKELFIKANAAMSQAKEAGGDRHHIYSPEDSYLEKMRSRFEWKGHIQKAIEEGRFEPWFQPILDLKDDKIHHYEALARMRSEDGKILLPGVFIDTAEIFGLIGTIDKIITEKVMKLQAETSRQKSSLAFGMNLSGKDLGNEELLSFLQSKIVETGADPSHLIFEITETAAVRDMDRAIKFINALKSIGCLFSLDDFGVGFTSFIYLKEMNVDYIKIDGSFIRRLNENQNDQLFVKAIVDVSKGMGIKTVAEFVENKEIIKLLKELNVDYAQGYGIGKPAPWKDL
ncbi:MAG TPA: hypothetical protein DD725_07830 [Deltaproteobacteria bacterium]|nr:hypothetical protein [Deltaproteobacteria bacterium]